MAELVDAPDLGSGGKPWGFESPFSHQDFSFFHVEGILSANDIKITEISPVEREVKIVIPAETFTQKSDEFFKENKGAIHMAGFRKGKVPKSLVIKRFRKEIQAKMVEDAFAESLESNNLNPVVSPVMKEPVFGDDGSITIRFTVETMPELGAIHVDGLEVDKERVEIDESAIEGKLEMLREQQADFQIIDDRDVTEETDWVDVSFRAWKEDENPEEIKFQDNEFDLSGDGLLPGLAENIRSKKKGEMFKFDIEMPEDHSNKALQGKTVHFEMMVKEIKKRVVPELDDEFAKDQGDYETLEQFKEHLRDEMREKEGERMDERFNRRLFENVLKTNDVPAPPGLIERQIDMLIEDQFRMMFNAGLGGDHIPTDNPELRKAVRAEAEHMVKTAILVEHIGNQDSIEVAEEEIDEYLKSRLDEENQANFARIKSQWQEQGQWDNVAFFLKERKIAGKLAENVVVKEVDPIPDQPPTPPEHPEDEDAAIESADESVPAGFKESESGLVVPEGETTDEEAKDE